MSLVPRIYINPYGKNQYQPSSSKSIFKEQNLHSNIINTDDINDLTNIFKDDSIIYGLEPTISILEDKTISVSLSPGRIIQDNTLIDIKQQINISLDVISIYNIISSNSSNNYFKISGNQINNFKIGKQFTIQNSSKSSFNHNYWVVKDVELVDDHTFIYTSQNISDDITTGQIVNDNFPSISNGTILIMSKYQFSKSMDENKIEFVPLFTKTPSNYFDISHNCVPGFDSNLYRILYCVIYITKNEHQILPNRFAITETTNINIQGHNYFNRPMIKQIDNFDGGEILIC